MLLKRRLIKSVYLCQRGQQTSSSPSPSNSTTTPQLQENGSAALPLEFSFAKHGSGFVLPEPRHQNSWTSDGLLTSYLRLNVPEEVMRDIEPDLTRFGERTAGEIWRLGRECEENPPYLRQTDAWGRRIDEIVTCRAWKEQKSISAEEGLIAIPYHRKQGEYSRLYQCAKLFMYSPSSGLYTCPLAMTDGAAKTIESLNLPLPDAFGHLTSRQPNLFWTAGQWMTERRGGSDVGESTETTAVLQQDGSYQLSGYKWFSSATDSDMALTLARIVDSQGRVVEGSKGLSMFYLKTRTEDGSLNNIQVVKLKNKLGTRQLPTAELLLDRTRAELVSGAGRGIASISSMLTVTRLHNVISSAAAMRKIVSLARDYASRRNAFGKKINQHPLHVQALARMEVETRGCSILMLDLARQMGLHDNNSISDQDLLLMRLMTPVAKLYTGKMAVATISEGLECFGGQGYIEDTGLPGLLRDSQVLPIWEGTSNVMSLDIVRAIMKTKGEVLRAFTARIQQIAKQVEGHPELGKHGKQIEDTTLKVVGLLSGSPGLLQFCGRDLAASLAHLYIGALLVHHASRTGARIDVDVAAGWLDRDLAPLLTRQHLYSAEYINTQYNIVYDQYTH